MAMFIVNSYSDFFPFVCLYVCLFYLRCIFSLSIWMFLNVHHKVLEAFVVSKKVDS